MQNTDWLTAHSKRGDGFGIANYSNLFYVEFYVTNTDKWSDTNTEKWQFYYIIILGLVLVQSYEWTWTNCSINVIMIALKQQSIAFWNVFPDQNINSSVMFCDYIKKWNIAAGLYHARKFSFMVWFVQNWNIFLFNYLSSP